MLLALAVFVGIPVRATLAFKPVRHALGHGIMHLLVHVFEKLFSHHDRALVVFSWFLVVGVLAAILLDTFAALSSLYAWLR